MARRLLAVLLASTVLGSSCSRAPEAREYTVEGQVLAVQSAEARVVIKHGDIKHFMPAMTMPFLVKDRALLAAAKPGDFVTATLVVTDDDAWLSRITPTGRHETLPTGTAAPRAMAAPLKEGDAVPVVTFLGHDGKPFSTGALQGRPWALTFVYTRCPLPTFCPTLEKRFLAVQEAIRSTPTLSEARLVSVSIDPDFDTPEVLRAHAATLGADTALWTFATGARDEVDRFGERFGVVVQRGSGQPEDLLHSMRTAVVDRQGRLARVFEGSGWDARELVAALERAAAR